MPLTNYGLDTLVGQELSKLQDPALPSFEGMYSHHDHWLTNFLLNTAFGHPIPNDRKAFGIVFLRRAEGAYIEYGLAHEVASIITSQERLQPSLYFRLLHHIEMAMSLIYQAHEFARDAIDTKLFQKGDGSPLQRLNHIYNKARHFKPSVLPADHLHRVWLTNESIMTTECSLSYVEFHELSDGIFSLAEKFVNPTEWVKKQATKTQITG